MRLPGDIQTYRVLLRGEGTDRQGEWVGFFAARQVTASSEAAAETEAVETVLSRWPHEGASVLAEVHNVSAMVTKPVRLPWFRRPRGGFAFFNDDCEAEAIAERIERRASGFPTKI
ncbi:MAG: hypothetical protein EON93_25290 [Burkholderiales bacterium]|nr:MAG: hypothetical protein EON93_25290 [Burkholderiales bacterium]